MPQLVFQKASVLCYRLFDIAEQIDLENARALAAEESRRLKLSRAGSEYLVLPNPPLSLTLGQRKLELPKGPLEVEATARLFDFGAVSVLLALPVPAGTTLQALVPLCDLLYDSPAVDRLCAEVVEQLRHGLSAALERPAGWAQTESYTVIFSEGITGEPSADALLADGDLARLLLGETGDRPLSQREVLDVLEHHFSYTDRDLAVIDWNAAFVHEPSGSRDIPDLLELANAQLLELRYFDDLLDRRLKETYAQLTLAPRRWYSLFRSPHRKLSRRMVATLFELSEFIERVENSLKIVGDFYLAKVYEAAVKQLRISSWQAQVTRKQNMLGQIHALLKQEVDVDRSQFLELTIVVLIILEVVLAFLPWKT